MSIIIAEAQENFGSRASGAYLIARDTGRALFILRSAKVVNPLCWSCAAGKTEEGETFATGCIRELKEEIGFEDEIKLVVLYNYVRSDFHFRSYAGIVEREFLPKLNWESAAHAWVEKNAWPKPLHPNSEQPLAVLANVIDAIKRD